MNNSLESNGTRGSGSGGSLNQLEKWKEIVYLIFLIVLATSSVILNSVVLILYGKTERIRKATVIFVPIFTFNDLCMTITRVTNQFILQNVPTAFSFTPYCIYVFAFELIIYTQSQYHLLFIFIFKYIKINFPFTFDEYYNVKRCFIIIIIIIIVTTIFGLFPVYMAIDNPTDRLSCNGYFKFEREHYGIYLSLFIPVIVGVTGLHIGILRIAKKHAMGMESQLKKIQNISYSSKFTLLQLLISILLWIVFGMILGFLKNIEPLTRSQLTVGLQYLLLTQLVVNPIITILGNSSIKLAFRKLFFCWKMAKIYPETEI